MTGSHNEFLVNLSHSTSGDLDLLTKLLSISEFHCFKWY